MLMLNRKIGEKIYIGEGDSKVVITIEDFTQSRVSLSVDAPKDMRVERSDVHCKDVQSDEEIKVSE